MPRDTPQWHVSAGKRAGCTCRQKNRVTHVLANINPFNLILDLPCLSMDISLTMATS